MPQTTNAEPVVIDFPADGETVASDAYTIRAAAPVDAEVVEIAIDDGEWLTCRPAVGYWWYDWTGYAPGSHEVAARARTSGGLTASQARRFRVVIAAAPVELSAAPIERAPRKPGARKSASRGPRGRALLKA